MPVPGDPAEPFFEKYDSKESLVAALLPELESLGFVQVARESGPGFVIARLDGKVVVQANGDPSDTREFGDLASALDSLPGDGESFLYFPWAVA